MTDTVTIDGIDYTADQVGDVREFNGFTNGFLTALEMVGLTDEQSVTPMLKEAFLALPKNLLDVMIHRQITRDIEEYLDEKVASGKLVDLGGGKYIETEKYDPAVHGEVECRNLDCGYANPKLTHVDH